MRSFKFSTAHWLLPIALLCALFSCKKDDVVEEIEQPASIELDKSTLLSELSSPDVINFFDLNFIELANPQLSGEVISNELDETIESVYMDFLIKNGELNFVPGLISQTGYPMWHRIEVSYGTEDEVLLIPFATEDGTLTNAVMVAIPRNNDAFYQEHDVNRPGYYYLSMTRDELATELENLETANDNTFSFLFHHLYFDEVIFDYRNEDWWTIWEDHEGLMSDEENGGEHTPPTEVVFRDLCSTTATICLPNAIVSGNDPSGTAESETLDFRDCSTMDVVYVWECPDLPGGFIPGGGSSSGGGGGQTTTSGAGGTGDGATTALNALIADCSSQTSVDVVVDNPQYSDEDCTALLAAIDNLGYSTLPPEIWLTLFEHGGSLLEEAATVSPGIDSDSYILYINYTLAGLTTQDLRVFQSHYRRAQNLQSQLGFDANTFQWLLDQAVGTSSGETSVAEEITIFLEQNTTTDAEEAARKYLSFLARTTTVSTNSTSAELVAFLKLQRSLVEIAHLDNITQEQLNFFVEYDDFNTIDGPTDGFFGDFSSEDDEIAPAVLIYILKKAAQAGAGALADIAVQWVFEYYLGEHPDFWTAWQALDINEWQALGSAIEAATTGKYAPIVSGMTAGVTYLLNEQEPTLSGFFTNISIGVVGGFIADNIADYVGSLRAAFTRYGFLAPYRGLAAMGIKSTLLQSWIARRAMINAIWEDLTLTTTKGFYFEEVLKYSRYSNGYNWINGNGEQFLKIDFFKPSTGTGVQLKSSAVDFRNNENAFSNFLQNGANQLKNAIENGVPGVGNIANGQLDVMIPPSKVGDIDILNHRAQTWLDDFLDENPGITITIEIGTFYD